MDGWSQGALDETLEKLARVGRPIAEATGLPNEAYRSAGFAAFERDQVLARTWTAVGVGRQVPEPGDACPVSLQGLPLVLVRGQDGQVRVFHNVCSHRGMVLVEAPKSCGRLIRCPYHAWSYDLQGGLQATPKIGGGERHSCPGFDKAKHGLKEVRSTLWCDTVFVDLSGRAAPFETFVAPLAERWRGFDWSLLRHGGAESHFELTLACNWKLAVENFCEAYHLPWIHLGLNSYSRLEDHYDIALPGHYAGQGSHAYRPSLGDNQQAFPQFPDLPEGWDGKGEYIALLPNALFGLHADHLFVVILLPEGPDRTRELFEIYYVGDAATGPDFAALRTANAEQWRVVFEEDRGVVEGMQRGRASPGFTGGAFSPAMDGPTHCFHQWMAGALIEGAATRSRPELAVVG